MIIMCLMVKGEEGRVSVSTLIYLQNRNKVTEINANVTTSCNPFTEFIASSNVTSLCNPFMGLIASANVRSWCNTLTRVIVSAVAMSLVLGFSSTKVMMYYNLFTMFAFVLAH